MSQLDRPGGRFPPNYWDAIVWMFQDMLPAAYEPIMADSVAVGDLVIVTARETSTQAGKPVSIGRVTEVNFADSAREGQTAYTGRGWLIKVLDMRPSMSMQENEYGTDAYDFYRLEGGEPEGGEKE